MARQTLGALAIETFERLGISWQLGAAQRRYNERLTTQVPWRTTFDTGKRRISRRLQIGKQAVTYENDLTRPAWRRRGSRSARPAGIRRGAGTHRGGLPAAAVSGSAFARACLPRSLEKRCNTFQVLKPQNCVLGMMLAAVRRRESVAHKSLRGCCGCR